MGHILAGGLIGGVIGGLITALVVGLLGGVASGIQGGIPMFKMPHGQAAFWGFFWTLAVFGWHAFFLGFILGAVGGATVGGVRLADVDDEWSRRGKSSASTRDDPP